MARSLLRNNFSYIFGSVFTFLIALVKCSLQETLSCGAASFQVTFEPSRPIFSNTLVAAAAAASSASNNGNGGNAGTLNSASGMSLFPTAKYLYRPLENLLSNTDVCNLSLGSGSGSLSSLLSGTIETLSLFTNTNKNNLLEKLPESRMIITKCDNCSRCPQELPAIHRLLSRMAAEMELNSLLVIVYGNLVVTLNGAPGTGNIQIKDIERGKLVENTVTKFVFMDEEPGQLTLCELMADSIENDALKNFSKTSVLFVSISFIILMVISLAWLVFYYVQRFRYAHAKDRLQRRLFNAAKKALTRIPTRPVKAGDKDLDLDCAVCIDPYKTGDIVRVLPCRHTFHKGCVDPWLLEHRTCPMCKSDILKAFGYQITINGNGSNAGNGGNRRRTQFLGAQVDLSSSENNHHNGNYGSSENRRNHYHHRRVGSVSHPSNEERQNNIENGNRVSNFEGNQNECVERSNKLSVDNEILTASEPNPFSFPIVNKVHDPFSFTPSTSPQLVKVIHSTNARGFSIIPLTVHNSMIVIDSKEQENNLDNKNGSGYARIYPSSVDDVPVMANKEQKVPLNDESKQEITARHLYSSDGNYGNSEISNECSARVFRAAINSTQHPTRGQVVNLLHVRSRSLTFPQLSATVSQSSLKEIPKINFQNDKTLEQTMAPLKNFNDSNFGRLVCIVKNNKQTDLVHSSNQKTDQ